MTQTLSPQDVECRLGAHVRAVRLALNLNQIEVARNANIAVNALRSLEAGRGARVTTLVRTLGVLGRQDWIDSLAPQTSTGRQRSCSGVEKQELKVLHAYALTDALATGLELPKQITAEALADFMAVAGDKLFLPEDPNLDNQKRNIAVRVFLSFSIGQMIVFGRSWLERLRKNSDAPWYREWAGIMDRGDAREITDILLSPHQVRVRQRLSMPFAEMLDFSVVLGIKRKYR